MFAEGEEFYKVIATNKAVRSIVEQSAYYLSNGGPELAKRWQNEVTAVMDSLQRFPNRGRPAQLGSGSAHLRRLLMRKFPYFVYYALYELTREGEVVNVIHASRNQQTAIKGIQ